jgi:SAM-dependent methyltransferase
VPPPENCIFYQTIDLPGIGTIAGLWDHRHDVDVYLGHIAFQGKTVVDVGPGNGFFSFEMEKRGARVTAVDLGQEIDWDLVPHPYTDPQDLRTAVRRNIAMVENAFWYCHRSLNSGVKFLYSSIYDLPQKVPAADIVLISNVLQHLSDPILAIRRAAAIATETLIITETLWHDDQAFIDSASMRLIPRAETPGVNHSWWQVTPSLLIEVLKLIGFQKTRSEIHYQQFNGTSPNLPPRMVKHFTLTASRAPIFRPESFPQLLIEYSHQWHAEESAREQRWRWASSKEAAINIHNLSPSTSIVNLYFGVGSPTPDAIITVSVNGRTAWMSNPVHEVRPVFIPSIALTPGNNSIIFASIGGPIGPTSRDSRILYISLYNFSLELA